MANEDDKKPEATEDAAAPEAKEDAAATPAAPEEKAPEKAEDSAPAAKAEEKVEAKAEEAAPADDAKADAPKADAPAAKVESKDAPKPAGTRNVPVNRPGGGRGGPGGRPGGPGGRPGGPGGRPGGPGGGRPGYGGNQRNSGSGFDDDGKPEISEKVVFINRCAKVVKGGRRFSFSALVVTGDHDGKVGFGFGKAQEVAECIRKASESSKNSMVKVPKNGSTIPHEILGVHGGGRVLLRPASPGTGIIAGGSVRAVLEAAGYKDVLTKSLGSNNHANVVKATLSALQNLRTKDEIYALRGKKVADKKAL